MADLIDRAAVNAFLKGYWGSIGGGMPEGPADEAILNTITAFETAIAALPAQGVDVAKLRQIANNLSCLDARSRGAAEAILAALEPSEAGGVEALVKAAEALIVIALDNLDGMNAETREECERDIAATRAALAAIREVK
jgi:hypothetical protein